MNTIVTLTTGKTLDVRLVKSYVVDARQGKQARVTVYLIDGSAIRVSIPDLECIETFRRELNQIKHEE